MCETGPREAILPQALLNQRCSWEAKTRLFPSWLQHEFGVVAST